MCEVNLYPQYSVQQYLTMWDNHLLDSDHLCLRHKFSL